jgi:dinuclear metal center YbgI/SA1388 family protein
MGDASSITRFLNKELKISDIMDDSRNGLQVRAKKRVNKIALGVDACMDIFKKAKQRKCDMVIVHHGLLWKGHKDILNIRKDRIQYLRRNKISLYACHLPLDRHPEYGNNIKLCRLLCLKNIKSFAKHNRKNIGFYGTLRTNIQDLIWRLESCLKTRCIAHQFGNKFTKHIGIVSGGAASHIYDCKKKGIDTYVTGEPKHSFYHIAKELDMNVIYAGHYATEKLGVQALGELVKQKFNIDFTFIDIPTNI